MSTDYKKLLELSIYISDKANGDTYLGLTKLNKILFLSDFHYYLKTGKSITNQIYLHFPNGPVPKDMRKVEKSSSDIAFKAAQIFDHGQKKPIALREPDLSVFNGDEIAFVDKIIDFACNKHKITAAWMSKSSHDYMGWSITNNGEPIPYNTIFVEIVSKQKATSFDLQHARNLAQELGDDYGFRASA